MLARLLSIMLAAPIALSVPVLSVSKDATAGAHVPCTALELKREALEQVIDTCGHLITSGKLEGEEAAEALRHQGDAYFRSYRMREAFDNYSQALEIRPDWPRALWNFGNAASVLGDNELALASQHRALEIDPDYAPAHVAIGSILYRHGDRAGAIAAYTKAIEIDPKSYHARLSRAIANRVSGRAMEAIHDLDALLSEDEEALNATYVHWNPALHQDFVSAVHLERAKTLEALGQFKQAIQALEVALARKPSFIPGVLNYSRMQVNEGQYSEALRALDAALRTVPDSWSLMIEKARVLVSADEEASARDILVASARFEENPPGKFFLDRAVVWRGLKEHQRAEADLMSAMQGDRGIFFGMINAMTRLGYLMELPGLDPETALANAVAACSRDNWCLPEYGG